MEVIPKWRKYAKTYDPIRIGSIDGTDADPHDRGIVRAIIAHNKPNESVVGDATRTVFVGRLHPKTGEDELKNKFRKCSKIVRCRVVRDIVTGHSKCYAFIEFESRSGAREAVHSMHKSSIHGYEILVYYELARTMPGWRPRRLGGGFGGKKESGQLRFGCIDRPFQRPIEFDNQSHVSNISDTSRSKKHRTKSDSFK